MPSVVSNIITIGNSKGIRIPRALLEQCHLTGKVTLETKGSCLLIRSISKPREGWEESFKAMAQREEDHLLDDAASTSKWDDQEWEW